MHDFVMKPLMKYEILNFQDMVDACLTLIVALCNEGSHVCYCCWKWCWRCLFQLASQCQGWVRTTISGDSNNQILVVVSFQTG